MVDVAECGQQHHVTVVCDVPTHGYTVTALISDAALTYSLHRHTAGGSDAPDHTRGPGCDRPSASSTYGDPKLLLTELANAAGVAPAQHTALWSR